MGDIIDGEGLDPGGGVLPYITIRVCAAQQDRDFEAPDLERVSILEAFFRTGYNI